jgi:VWFA-related protein
MRHGFRQALLLLILAGAARAGDDSWTTTRRLPSFGTGVEMVNLNVSVVDGRSRYVTDLGEADFAIFEQGVRQRLAYFLREDLPLSMLLLMDTSGSMEQKLPMARAAASRFVRMLRPQDTAAIVQFSGRVEILQEGTPELPALESAIAKTRASGNTALYDAVYIGLKELSKSARSDELRRRAILLLSDGADTASLLRDEQVLELSRKTDVMVYPVALREQRPSTDPMEANRSSFFLSSIARESGGQLHCPRTLVDLEGVYERIVEGLRTQYTVGYVSSNDRRDGRWRNIVVQTPGRNGLQLRHKVGYYAPREPAASPR